MGADHACKRKGILLRPDLELCSLQAVKALPIKRPLQYYTILPAHSVREEVDNRIFSQYAIDDPDMLRTISIMTSSVARNAADTDYLQRHIEERSRVIKARLPTVF